jgi:O-antigen ligase
VAASHTIPITVSAEQGLIGLALYAALLIAALWRLASGARGDPYRAVVLAGFVAVIVHTWMYAAFLEDPLVWALLAVGVALARAPRVRARSAPSRDGRTRSPAPPSARTAAG